ncbi:MAG: porin family protein [Bacteroidia bacterium]|nr:porin family protein [Bacteroidia bacterium]
MRKTILTITLMTMVLSTFAIGPFTIGLKAGLNSSKITTDNFSATGYTYNDFKSDAKSGFNFGAFARFGTKVYLQPELLYCIKNGQSSSGSASQSLKLKTIQVPVLLGFKLVNLKIASIRAFTGPAMSIVMKSSSVTYAGVTAGLFDTKNFKNNIWDWQLGAGVDVGMITFDVRYAWGITNVSDVNTSVSNIGFNNKGNTLTFSLGFKFI